MRLLLVLGALLAAGTASAGPFRQVYSTCYRAPSYYSYSYAQPVYYAPAVYAAPVYVAPAAPAYTPPAVPTYTPDWRTQALKYLNYREDYAAFDKFIGTVAPEFAVSHSSASYPGQASTLYGYSYKTVAEAYNPVDLNQMDQRTARLIEGVRESLSQANTERSSNIAQLTDAQARVAEVRAKGEAAALVQQQAALLLQSTNAAASNRTTTTVSGTGVAPTQVIQPAVAAQNPQWAEFMKVVARPDCQRCHTAGPGMKGNFDIESLPRLNRSQAAHVLDKITSVDAATVMPKPEAGKPIVHVPPYHMMAWATMLSQVQ